MRLETLFEGVIKVPQSFVKDVHKSVMNIFMHHVQNSMTMHDENRVEEIFNNTKLQSFKMNNFEVYELNNDFGRYSDMIPLKPKEVKYNPFPDSIADRKEYNLQPFVLIPIVVRFTKGTSLGSFTINSNEKPVIIVNLHNLQKLFFETYKTDDAQKEKALYNKINSQIEDIYSTIEHESMHMIQGVYMHPEQISKKSDYSKTDAGYYTSESEIKPHLITARDTLYEIMVGNDVWESFTVDERKHLVMQFMGLKNEPLKYKVNNKIIDLNVPVDSFFEVLKKEKPTRFKRVASEFYSMVKDWIYQ